MATTLQRCGYLARFAPCWKALDGAGATYAVVAGSTRTRNPAALSRCPGAAVYPALEFEDGTRNGRNRDRWLARSVRAA
jgi:hypothetical protein